MLLVTIRQDRNHAAGGFFRDLTRGGYVGAGGDSDKQTTLAAGPPGGLHHVVVADLDDLVDTRNVKDGRHEAVAVARDRGGERVVEVLPESGRCLLVVNARVARVLEWLPV